MCCGPKARPDRECTCDNGYAELLAETLACPKCESIVPIRDLVFSDRFMERWSDMVLGCALCVPFVRVGEHGEARAVPA